MSRNLTARKPRLVESDKNKMFKAFKSLLTSSGIRERGQALIFGEKAVREIMRDHPESCVALLTKKRKSTGLLACYELSPKLFDEIDVFGTGSEILVVRVPEFKIFRSNDLKNLGLLIPFQEPSNVGAVLRSAAAFGVDQILLSRSTAHPFHPKSSRAASGTLFSHEYFIIENLGEVSAVKTIGLDKAGKDIRDFTFPEKFILVPGLEGPGLKRVGDINEKISIKINSSVESLNAPVATSIALYEWSKRRAK